MSDLDALDGLTLSGDLRSAGDDSPARSATDDQPNAPEVEGVEPLF